MLRRASRVGRLSRAPRAGYPSLINIKEFQLRVIIEQLSRQKNLGNYQLKKPGRLNRASMYFKMPKGLTRDLCGFYLTYPRSSWPFPQPISQFLNFLAFATQQGFYSSIG